MDRNKKTKRIVFIIIGAIAFYAGNRTVDLYNRQPSELQPYLRIERTAGTFLQDIVYMPFRIGARGNAIFAGLFMILIILWIYMSVSLNDDKKFMDGKEYGSARFGSQNDILPFINKDFDNNIILTATESLTMESQMESQEYNRNKNVIVVGSSGSGKTRFFIKPNLMQCGSDNRISFVITDPKGSIIHECGKMLEQEGYEIKCFNLIEYSQSDHYNPFRYIRNEIDILSLIENLLSNTDGGDPQAKQDFWAKSEKALLCALIGYVYYLYDEEDQNFNSVLELLEMSKVKENDDEFLSPLDLLFADVKTNEKVSPFVWEQYTIFKAGAGVTIKSIIISVGVRLAPFTMPTLRNLCSKDTLNLETIGDEKTALFIVIPDTNKTLNFLVAIMYQQLFDTLCRHADIDCDGKLAYHVRFLLDEFANIGIIPNFEIYIATVRSRGMSFNIALQTLAQLKSIYDKKTEIITGNADSLLFLGGTEESTLKFFSEAMGKTTVDIESRSYSYGSSGSMNKSYQKIARELMTPDEVGKMSRSECLLLISNLPPFKSKKYDITKHPRYSLLSDSDRANYYIYRKK